MEKIFKRLIKAKWFNAVKAVDGNYYDCFKNPSSEEFNEINEKFSGGIRMIIDSNGDLYTWSAEFTHDKAISGLNLPHGIHISYDFNKFVLYITPDDTIETLSRAIKKSDSLLSYFNLNLPLDINTKWYGANRNENYKKLKTINDILNCRGEENEKID